MKRRRSLHTIGVYDTTRIGPFILMRAMIPRGDAYEQGFNPHVDLSPYVAGVKVYSVVLRAGGWRLGVEKGGP